MGAYYSQPRLWAPSGNTESGQMQGSGLSHFWGPQGMESIKNLTRKGSSIRNFLSYTAYFMMIFFLMNHGLLCSSVGEIESYNCRELDYEVHFVLRFLQASGFKFPEEYV